ncbi:MAG: class I SAM-dependent methyltransferase [Anaerolineaceae bacterium]|nr:class I SAM-dependent methyltransferase [Anaerolineaceae bacterium]
MNKGCDIWLATGVDSEGCHRLNMKTIHLKSGRDQSVRQRHPWIFSGAIARVVGDTGCSRHDTGSSRHDTGSSRHDTGVGETVLVCAAGGEKLGLAAYSPHSSIRARMWTWNPDETVDSEFIVRRVQSALDLRRAVIPEGETNAMRLVHGESDGLPGVIVDRYADVLVLQCLTAGAERWRGELVEALTTLTGAWAVFERSDVDIRALEGLPERAGLLHGSLPDQPLIIVENGLLFRVDIERGQKTGFYLDQRRNRQRVRELVTDRRVLNCFCYSGAFSVYAMAGGAAEVLSVDSAPEALALAAENAALNGIPSQKLAWQAGDVFEVLRSYRDRNLHFDAVILDPPKFAPTSAQVQRAARGYKDINLLAFKLLNPGGLLFTFSCSGGVSAELFDKIVAGAALDAGVQARIIERFSQGADHPVGLNFPEGAYLKGLALEVSG